MGFSNTSSNKFGPTSFVVGETLGNGCNYAGGAGIQQALDDAFATGQAQTVYIRQSSIGYTVNLNLRDRVDLEGVCIDGRDSTILIVGTHIIPDASVIRISNLFFTTSTLFPTIFSFAAPPTVDTAIEMKNCQCLSLQAGATIMTIAATGGGTVRIYQESMLNFSSGENYLLSGACNLTIQFGSYTSTSGRLLRLTDSVAEIHGAIIQAATDAFLMDNGTEVLSVDVSQVTCQGVCYSGPLGGTVTSSHNVITCNDAGGDYVTGSVSYNYASEVLTGTAKGIGPIVGDFPATWKPFATDGLTGTAVRGTAGFDQSFFSVVDGFVSPGASAPQTFTTDSGTATPILGDIQILGGPGVTTSAATNVITINAVTWSNSAGSSGAAEDTGTFAQAAQTQTLPNAPAQGTVCKFIVDTAVGLLTIQAQGLDVIHLGNQVSVVGTLISVDRGDSISLVYKANSAAWYAEYSIGNWSVI